MLTTQKYDDNAMLDNFSPKNFHLANIHVLWKIFLALHYTYARCTLTLNELYLVLHVRDSLITQLFISFHIL